MFIFMAPIHGQTKDSLIKVTDGVYMITGHMGNIAFLENEKGVILVDAGNTPESGKRIMELVKTVTNKPIVNIIITHGHFDHIGGLVTLPTTIPILAHPNTKANIIKTENDAKVELRKVTTTADSLQQLLKSLSKTAPAFTAADSTLKATLKRKNELAGSKFIYPNTLIEKESRLTLGKDTIQIFYPGQGHTNGDLVVVFKKRGVMVTGDLLFNHAYPYIDVTGNTENWAALLRTFAAKSYKAYIPGHGNTASAPDLLLLAQYLEDLRAAVKSAKAEGKSLEEIKKLVSLPAYETFDFPFFKIQNIEGTFNQLK
jgi:glyoxylase-like metal-dependent hydrolase (beta-lactamase superfamily II)